VFGKNEPISLSALRGKVVLLDFWIFHCGPCQDGVPKMNTINEKYKKRDFQLLSVNVGDTPKLIDLFIKTTGAEFTILQNGDEAAKRYGVIGFPTAVLIGKDGKVIYSGGFDYAKVDALIEQNLR
ncbi:MAG TPA: TlpA disulfide reductase family protein, partial [Pyrinomonadaceae bacterium]